MTPFPAGRFLNVVLAVTLVTSIGLGIQQYRAYSGEFKVLSSALHRVTLEIDRMNSLERKQAELAVLIDKVENRLSDLRLQIPSLLEPEGFGRHVTMVADELGIAVRDVRIDVESRQFYNRAQLDIELSGGTRALETLVQRIRSEGRFVRCRVARSARNDYTVTVSIFAIPDAATKFGGGIEDCPHFESQVWLLPFRNHIHTMAAELAALCNERTVQLERLKQLSELKKKMHRIRVTEEVLRELKLTPPADQPG
jgi:Tfp pilus assembly protein PilO